MEQGRKVLWVAMLIWFVVAGIIYPIYTQKYFLSIIAVVVLFGYYGIDKKLVK